MDLDYPPFRLPPPDSYSRQLDYQVCQSEMPYGYEVSPPPADTGDFDTKARESKIGLYHA